LKKDSKSTTAAKAYQPGAKDPGDIRIRGKAYMAKHRQTLEKV
jgi:hypothetical protein